MDKVLALLLFAALAPFGAGASPTLPSAPCAVEGKLIRPLGRRSTLRPGLGRRPPSARPHACATPQAQAGYLSNAYRVEIIKSVGGPKCPRAGQSLVVHSEAASLPALFKGSLQARGDECFEAQFLQLID